MPGKRKPCDGTANDFWRHVKRKEPPCRRSKKAQAVAMRRYRDTLVWVGDIPYLPDDDLVRPPIEGAQKFVTRKSRGRR